MNEAEEYDGYLLHEGVSVLDGAPGRGSGRYPLGSGEKPNQHSGDFYSRVKKLKKEGLTDAEIGKMMGISSTKLRALYTNAKNEERANKVALVISLQHQGFNNTQIAKQLGLPGESSVRALLKESSQIKMTQAQKTADFLRQQVEEKGMIDIGTGVEREPSLGGISRTKLNAALEILRKEGYPVYGGGVPQVTNPGKQTNIKVLCPKGTEHKEIYEFDKIHTIEDYISPDGGTTFRKAFEYPASMDSKRMKVRYAEEGGLERDGTVEIRRGVKDLSLGDSHYAQVRILVDGTHYIKGMAVYGDDMPDGVDVIFNTNKKKGTPLEKVLKPIHDDPANPFGSLIKEHGGQSYYDDPDGKFIDNLTGKKQSLSLINKRAEEGDWDDWTNKLPSQFLSKQSKTLIKKQLDLAAADKQAEYDDICALTNPTLKKVMLESFANDCDSAAVHLHAAALPRQRYQVILPMPSMKETEVYAPNYKDGEKVALIRYPHGGLFEIPILTVNNKVKEARRVLGTNPIDAVGINSKVAERLSGADFDGDTVMVIPTGKNVKISSQPPLKGLKGFDPKERYPEVPGMKYMKNPITGADNTQNEMGKISNLITDMTLRGASEDELARAVRHSMVVIDAAKHKLNYKQSEKDNDIKKLKQKYQGRYDENGHYSTSAATLISRAKSEKTVDKRQGQPHINQKGKEWYDDTLPEGALIFKTASDLTYTDKKGKLRRRTQKSDAMSETRDARTLISEANTPQEILYADYANKMKALANSARKEMIYTGRITPSAAAKKTYQAEVDSLMAKLNVSLKNAPRERKAQLMANTVVDAMKQEHPDMTKKEIKKKSHLALTEARLAVGAKRHPIDISDREWEAIQSGAISENKLLDILNNADLDKLKERATPRAKTALSSAKINLIKSMSSSGYTTEQIADRLGVSSSTVIKYLKGSE